MAYSTEADVLADGYTKMSTHEGGVCYEKIVNGIPLRHEFPSGVSTANMAGAVERVRAERVSKGKNA